jgi:arabinose-5-phosphate isomerase
LKSSGKILTQAKRTFDIEADSIRNLKARLNSDFIKSIELIYNSKGRVVVTGVGKSAIIAEKIVATFNSTGTPSIFMHAADAIHGDLGIILEDDVVICISNSGNTPEIKVLIPVLHARGNKLIAMTGHTDSYLAKNCDFVLNTFVEKEACPNNLAPTSSTTAQIAMGDALAVCLLTYRGFSKKDFAMHHPGGALGKKLYLTVGELAASNAAPKVSPDDEMRDVILVMTSNRLGATAVVDKKGKLCGVITDGDLRRMLMKNKDTNGIIAKDVMTASPKKISTDTLAADAFKMMSENNITQLIVTDKGKYAGMIHLHDLIKEGII